MKKKNRKTPPRPQNGNLLKGKILIKLKTLKLKGSKVSMLGPLEPDLSVCACQNQTF